MFVTVKFKSPIMIDTNIEQSFLSKVHMTTVQHSPEIVCITGVKLKQDIFVPISNVSSYFLEK